MDFQTGMKLLSDRVIKLKGNIQTEEATKNALVMPFIQLLGYDIFNPMEVIPEFTADVGIKKGEKVDYAILKDNNPIIIIECKHWVEDLNIHDSQLFRYFHTTKARFGVLTNGIKYRFYTDLVEPNKMDTEPFLEIDFENLKESTINELIKFHKSSFDIEKIVDSASELKYSTMIKTILEKELNEPSEDFVKFFARQIYSGRLTASMMDQFKEIVKKATNQSFKEIVNDRLKAALKKEEEVIQKPAPEIQEEIEKIITTEDEIEAFHIIKSIVRIKIDISRIVGKDTQSYFGVLLDGKPGKPICRFHFNGPKKYIGLLDENKKEDRILLNKMDDIYQYSERIIETALRYDSKNQ